MVNRHRGEMTLKVNGHPKVLCLTLGALAELEDRYHGEDILSLVDKFAKVGLSATDVLNVLRAGLLGAGNQLDGFDLSVAQFEGGFAGATRAAAGLLKISFGLMDADGEREASPLQSREVTDESTPFLGVD